MGNFKWRTNLKAKHLAALIVVKKFSVYYTANIYRNFLEIIAEIYRDSQGIFTGNYSASQGIFTGNIQRSNKTVSILMGKPFKLNV